MFGWWSDKFVLSATAPVYKLYRGDFMSEKISKPKHRLVAEQREAVAITGVVDVISFDEEQVVCETDAGVLILRGAGLHVSNLNLDSGSLDIFGMIEAIVYEDAAGPGRPGRKPSLFGKIFK